ncbi:MAG: hypothetical protein HKM06_01685 [Spirochaetales bacterium]|nr:hypothetical protein [Spirochaetales bacterium]
MRKLLLLLTILLGCAGFAAAQAQDVRIVHDSNGWKIQVDGKDLAIHGVVWSYTPIGQNYTYNLWKQPEDVIKTTVDTDMTLMKAMGVNAIRIFADIPPKWVTYIYDKYGIFSMINNLFGRYGISVDGRWQFPTNYSDPETRKALLASAQAMFNEYKNTRGVLLFMLGNESNYGLEWKSTAIENLPVGERNKKKAEYLYSLFEQAIDLGHKIDPNHPMGLINGDVQYLDLIASEVKDLDVLGVNVYRGKRSSDAMYAQIASTLNKPFLYSEFGCDAYNAKTHSEDQIDQADFIASQWKEVYQESYGKGKSENCLGGFVFEWMDEWWKTYQTYNLSIHSTAASWSNGGYSFDYQNGENNMNEEWFGIVANSELKTNGIDRRVPRAAYYTLQKIWKLNQLDSSAADVDNYFAQLNVPEQSVLALEQSFQDPTDRRDFVHVHGNMTARSYTEVNSNDWASMGLSGTRWANEATSTVTLDATPQDNLDLSTTFRFATPYLSNQLDLPMEGARPGYTGYSYYSSTNALSPPSSDYTAEIYQSTMTYTGKLVDLTLHYHDGHPDWVGEGDYFQIMPETFDFFAMDQVGSKAPFGLEADFHGPLDGLKIYGGPEVYFGANPSVLAKYEKTFGTFSFAVMDQEEYATATPWTALSNGTVGWVPTYVTTGGATLATPTYNLYSWNNPQENRRTSLWADYWMQDWNFEGGILAAKLDRVGDPSYTYNTTTSIGNQFTVMDALAFKADVTTTMIPYVTLHGRFIYAGPLTDLPAGKAYGGSQLADVGMGNRMEAEFDVTGAYGPYSLMEKALSRVPIYAPDNRSPTTTTTAVGSPFIVSANRQAMQFETLFAYNPGGVYLFNWDTNETMDAPMAGYVSFLYNAYLGPTDQIAYLNSDLLNYYDYKAMPAISGTWSLVAHAVGDPGQGFHYTADFGAGYSQTHDFFTTSGVATNTWEMVGAKLAWRHLITDANFYFNDYGPQGWMFDQNVVYPLRWSWGIAYALDQRPSFLNNDNRIGLRLTQWFYNSGSQGQYDWNGSSLYDYGYSVATNSVPSNLANPETYRFEAELYASISF